MNPKARSARERSSAVRSKFANGIGYVRRNFDEAAILAVAAKLAFEDGVDFSDSELATIAAMKRAHPQAGQTHEELGEWLASMDEGAIAGVVSNTKGVLHEMEFVRLENEDGDSVYASLFEHTNHSGTDVSFMDKDSGASWEVQLKATDQPGYVQDWIDAHPDGEILVTSELAERMGLPSSGMSNEELTVRTDEVVDRLLKVDESSDLWDFFPTLTAASIGMVVWELWQRRQRGEISHQQFKWMAVKVSGMKAGKIALLTAAMMVPGLNVVTGAALVASLLFSGAGLAKALTK